MRTNSLSRTGMYQKAFYYIVEKDDTFPYNLEDWEQIQKTLKYDPTKGTTSKQFDKLCKAINNWLNNHFDMFELDYTHFDDNGSRNECVLCYNKREGQFEHPDFANELPKLVLYR